MQGKAGRHTAVFQKFQQKADFFMCSLLGKGSRNIQKTPGGLIFRQRWNNMQFVTSASFLTTVYSDYLTSSRSYLRCSAGNVAPSQLLSFAKSQVDYILGDNPRATSYMVGYGNNFPQRVHHRGSSIVSYKVDRSFVTCRGGYATWFSRKGSDPNLLTGAIVGGPDAYDNFADRRDNYEQTEPATYNNAPLLGVLARLSSGHSGYSQLLPGLCLRFNTFQFQCTLGRGLELKVVCFVFCYLCAAVPAPVVVRRPMPIRKPRVTSPVRGMLLCSFVYLLNRELTVC